MRWVFYTARSFNQPLNKWNVSDVKDMESMFEGASSFNQPLNKWNVSKAATIYLARMSLVDYADPRNYNKRDIPCPITIE